MLKRLLTCTILIASPLAYASMLQVDIFGPGGHSSGNYGNTNAVHAASRSILEIEKVCPDCRITNFTGGTTVNAIAADAHFTVHLPGNSDQQAKASVLVAEAVKVGCDKENAFRSVKPGDMVRGFPANIHFTIHEK